MLKTEAVDASKTPLQPPQPTPQPNHEVTLASLSDAAADLLYVARRILHVDYIARAGQTDAEPVDTFYVLREFPALVELAKRAIAKAEVC